VARGREIVSAVAKRKRSDERPVITGIVDWFNAEEGWGALSAPEVPGGCFVHYSDIQADGYRALTSRQRVQFTFEEPGFLQDGYRYRAVAVWPLG
jgi:CspA family cold shock protein